MVVARMMVPLRGDLATRLAPQRFWFGMEASGPLPLLAELVMAHQGWQNKLNGQRSVAGNGASPALFGASSLLQISKASAGQSRLADLVAVAPFGSPKDLSPTPIATPTTGRSQA